MVTIPVRDGEVREVEMDEFWSFIQHKADQCWTWVALDRLTRQVVGVAHGDHSEQTAQRLWETLAPELRQTARFYTDRWTAYPAILPADRHVIGKAGTQRIERFNNTCRQRCPNLVRKTLSFSKDREMHIWRINTFFEHYNQQKSV
jgi:insertion element IS1 protein InsB